MFVEISLIDEVTVVTLRVQELSRANCPRIWKSIAGAVDFRSSAVIDFGGIKQLDTSGLSLIVHWIAECRRFGGRLAICSNSSEFRALMELVQIPSYTTIHPSINEALDACSEVTAAMPSAERSLAGRVSRVRAVGA